MSDVARNSSGRSSAAEGEFDRTVLPVAEPSYPPITELDANKAKAPPRFEVKAPKGAPNVVVILLDNMGFGDVSTFGGPIQMPTLDRLAQTGLRYNNFKVPPLCSPSRVALLTGRNSHSANFGVISEIATGFPGYTAKRPSSVTMLPETLRLNGYSTAMFGKCHELGPWEASVVGPFDRWPVFSGFERFYGFMSGEADLFHPVIYDNMGVGFFRYGELPLVLLALLRQSSMNGYEMLGELGKLFSPGYAPSPGSVYPAISALLRSGLIGVEDDAERSGTS